MFIEGFKDYLSESETNLLPIGKASKKAGVSRHSVQYYVMVGLLEASQKTPSGRNLFGPEAIERIRMIKQLNESGYTLRAIRELFLKDGKLLKGNDL